MIAKIMALLALLALVACHEPKKAAPPRDLRIGAILPLTGPEAGYGVSCRSGIDLAIAEANAEGGILGRKVRAFYLDSQGRPEDSALAAQRSITKDKVDFLIGEVSSAGALAIAQIADRAKTPMISPAATSPLLTEAGPYVFRVAYADPFQALAMASFARDDLKLTRVAVLRDLSSEYSLRLAQAFGERFVAAGGVVAFDEAFDRVDASVFPVVEKLVAAEVEAVYLPLYEEEILRIVSAASGMGARLRFLGSDGWDVATVVQLGPPIEGSYFTSHYSADEPRPEVQHFVKAFSEIYNEQPDAMAALGYDAVQFGLSAIRREGSSDRARLAKALAAPPPYPGVTGDLTLDRRRQPQKAAVVLQIVGGRRKFIKRVAPDLAPSLAPP